MVDHALAPHSPQLKLKLRLLLLLPFLLLHLLSANAEIIFKERFEDGWESSWVKSDWKRSEGNAGSFKHTARLFVESSIAALLALGSFTVNHEEIRHTQPVKMIPLKMNPFAEQEAWEEHQIGKASLSFRSKDRKEASNDYHIEDFVLALL